MLLFLLLYIKLHHSHKKRKVSLETRPEPAVLCVYVENHAPLEPILLYRNQNVNKTKIRVAGLFMDLLFHLLLRQI